MSELRATPIAMREGPREEGGSVRGERPSESSTRY